MLNINKFNIKKLVIIIVILITLVAFFLYFNKRYINKNETLIYINKISTKEYFKQTEKEIKLFELCKIWGALKYHDTIYNKNVIMFDTSLIKSYYEIEKNKNYCFDEINNIIKLYTQNQEINNNIFINNFPDKEWIKSSKLINHQNKNKIINYILKSYNYKGKRIIEKNKYGVLNFEKDSLFFYKKHTNKGLRFLTLCKIWNIIRYYYPYFEEISNNWDEVFFEMLPLFINAKNDDEYFTAILKFSTKLKDSHVGCKIYSKDDYNGKYTSNSILKTIENRTFVKGFVTKILNSNLKKGDEIIAVNDTNIDILQDSVKNYLSGSNEVVLNRDVNKTILLSNKKTISLSIIRNGKFLKIKENLTFVNVARKVEEKEHKSNASKVVSQIIGNNIGYINIKNVFSGNFRISYEKIKKCKAIIFDLRFYPNEIGCDFLENFDVFQNNPMILYSADVNYPGFMKSIKYVENIPNDKSNSYSQPVIILINEYTQSQGESLTLAMRNIKNSIIIGENSAGTNGNITIAYLPGNVKIRFSSIGVLQSNFNKTQRIGIKPDILIQENVKTLKTGVDIQLKTAINYINNL
jgi:C-terminal processing protease CtpA/Prc